MSRWTTACGQVWGSYVEAEGHVREHACGRTIKAVPPVAVRRR